MDKYFAIPSSDFYYVVHIPTGKSQHEDEIEITEEQYLTLLEANQKHGHIIRAKVVDGKLCLFSCQEQQPSDYHTWSVEQGKWVVDEERHAKHILEEAAAFLQSLLDKKTSLQADMQMHLLLDEREEAKAIALQLKELNEEISGLQEEQ